MTDATPSGTAGTRRAVTLYRNGSVYTAADPFATAMVVDGDTVAWVGSEQAATSIADSSMEIIDLRGALVAPGFVDSHMHLTETGIALESLELGSVRSARELLDAVAGAAAGGTGPLLGHGWDESLWTDPTLPGQAELERAAGGRPAYLSRVDVHSALISQSLAASARAEEFDGYSTDGLVKRQAHAAARLAARDLPEDALRAFQKRALEEAAANGYVALAEMGAPHIGSMRDLQLAAGWNATGDTAARDAAAGDTIEARPEILPYWGQLVTSAAEAETLLAQLGAPVRGLAGDLNIDGSIGSRTAALRTPYADAPGERGATYLSTDEAAAHLAACSLLGIQGGFHVIGDAGLDAALDALDLAAAEVGEQRLRAAG
ncbi:MAG: amidohydrolase, partial [Arthrobacter sp.]|nr:amidohydrolase [Arthrobacter sp.]